MARPAWKRKAFGFKVPSLRGIAAGHNRITKREWENYGGFSNPHVFRKMVGRRWTYWYRAR